MKYLIFKIEFNKCTSYIKEFENLKDIRKYLLLEHPKSKIKFRGKSLLNGKIDQDDYFSVDINLSSFNGEKFENDLISYSFKNIDDYNYPLFIISEKFDYKDGMNYEPKEQKDFLCENENEIIKNLNNYIFNPELEDFKYSLVIMNILNDFVVNFNCKTNMYIPTPNINSNFGRLHTNSFYGSSLSFDVRPCARFSIMNHKEYIEKNL